MGGSAPGGTPMKAPLVALAVLAALAAPRPAEAG
jgi:hypothetical protein